MPRDRVRALGALARGLDGSIGWLLILALVALWQVAATEWPHRSLPPFTRVLAAYVDILTGASLARDVLPSIGRAVLGLGIAVALGIVAGIPLGLFKACDPWVRPPLEFIRSMPPSVLLSPAIIVLGTGSEMRVVLIAFGALFPVLWNAIDGARRVDQQTLDVARVSRFGHHRTLWRVVLPAALPQIFAGIRISLGITLIMMVISELIAAPSGIGVLIFRSQRVFRVADTYAGLVLLGTLGWGLMATFTVCEKRVIGWQAGWRASTQ